MEDLDKLVRLEQRIQVLKDMIESLEIQLKALEEERDNLSPS